MTLDLFVQSITYDGHAAAEVTVSSTGGRLFIPSGEMTLRLDRSVAEKIHLGMAVKVTVEGL